MFEQMTFENTNFLVGITQRNGNKVGIWEGNVEGKEDGEDATTMKIGCVQRFDERIIT